jgi:hypothetical protein
VQLPTETGLVLNGSYIVFICVSGYVNTGGSLNITCNQNGAWSSFPNCVSSTGGGGAVTTTTMSTGTSGTACVVNTASTFNITNGYLLSSALSFASNTAATGEYT